MIDLEDLIQHLRIIGNANDIRIGYETDSGQTCREAADILEGLNETIKRVVAQRRKRSGLS
jgi:hypothetical protein